MNQNQMKREGGVEEDHFEGEIGIEGSSIYVVFEGRVMMGKGEG